MDPYPTHSSAERMSLQRGGIPLPSCTVALMWTQRFHKILIRKITAKQFAQLDLGSFEVPAGYQPTPDPSSTSSGQHRHGSSGSAQHGGTSSGRVQHAGGSSGRAQPGGASSSGTRAENATHAVAKADRMQEHLRNLITAEVQAVAAGNMERSAQLRAAIKAAHRDAAQAVALAKFAVARRDAGEKAAVEPSSEVQEGAVESEVQKNGKLSAEDSRRRVDAVARRVHQAMQAQAEEAQRKADAEAQHRAEAEAAKRRKAESQAMQSEEAPHSCAGHARKPSCKDSSSAFSQHQHGKASGSLSEGCSKPADSATLQDRNTSKQGPQEAAKGTNEHTHSSHLQDSSDDGMATISADQVSLAMPPKPAAPTSPYSCWGQVFPNIAAAEDAAVEARKVAEAADAVSRKAQDAVAVAEGHVKALQEAMKAKPTEAKPTEAKPTEAKPTEAKPTKPKPKDLNVDSTALAAASATIAAVAASGRSIAMSVTAQRRKDKEKQKEEAAAKASALAVAEAALAAADAHAAPLKAKAAAARAAAADAQRAVYRMQAVTASEMHSSPEVERLRACRNSPAWLNPAVRFPPVLMSAEYQTPESEALIRHLGMVSWVEPEQYMRVDLMHEGVPSELWCPRQYIQGRCRDVGMEVQDAPRKRPGVLGRACVAGERRGSPAAWLV